MYEVLADFLCRRGRGLLQAKILFIVGFDKKLIVQILFYYTGAMNPTTVHLNIYNEIRWRIDG